MGSCCSSDSKDTAAASQQQPNRPTFVGQGRVLGGSDNDAAVSSAAAGETLSPREAAGRAALEREQARQNAAAPKGKIGRQLQEQRKATRSEVLAGASAEERRRREIEDNRTLMNYN